ncbi:MAG: CAP domain-containing protein [Bacteroidota bacterium]
MKQFILILILFLVTAVSWEDYVVFAKPPAKKTEAVETATKPKKEPKPKLKNPTKRPKPKPIVPKAPDPIPQEPESDLATEKIKPPKAKTPNTSSAGKMSVFQRSMLTAVNQKRSQRCKCGKKWYPPVKPLRWNHRLETAARKHTLYMVKTGNFSHTGFRRSSPGTRAKMEGYAYSYVGENIAKGQDSVAEVVQDWMDSPGHCKLIMDPEFLEMGAYRSGEFWTLDFGTRVR